MFASQSTEGYQSNLPGIRMKTLCYGSLTLMTEFRLAAGSSVPPHAHPHEQTGYLVKGRLELTEGDVTHDVSPGDSWCVPADVEHWSTALEDTVIVEVFAPVREEFLPDDADASPIR